MAPELGAPQGASPGLLRPSLASPRWPCPVRLQRPRLHQERPQAHTEQFCPRVGPSVSGPRCCPVCQLDLRPHLPGLGLLHSKGPSPPNRAETRPLFEGESEERSPHLSPSYWSIALHPSVQAPLGPPRIQEMT